LALSEVIIKNLSLTQWGIIIIALWSLVLAFLALANLLLITSIVQSAALAVNVVQTWMVFGLNIILLIAFSLSAYGLLRQQPWGRLLFLAAVIVWAGLNFFALFSVADTPGQNRTTPSLYIDASRYAAALIISLVYLNLPRVKQAFQSSSGYLDNKDQTDNDNIN
jgi:hypothetical protein